MESRMPSTRPRSRSRPSCHRRGDAATVQSYLRAGRINELHVAIPPILLGGGSASSTNSATPGRHYRRTQLVSTRIVTHVVLSRT
jgi:hypothetical protein